MICLKCGLNKDNFIFHIGDNDSYYRSYVKKRKEILDREGVYHFDDFGDNLVM